MCLYLQPLSCCVHTLHMLRPVNVWKETWGVRWGVMHPLQCNRLTNMDHIVYQMQSRQMGSRSLTLISVIVV
jgi:hypothetical protein